jgi:hypothetical protein
LNRNHNPQLKQVFKGAALTALRHEAIKELAFVKMDKVELRARKFYSC